MRLLLLCIPTLLGCCHGGREFSSTLQDTLVFDTDGTRVTYTLVGVQVGSKPGKAQDIALQFDATALVLLSNPLLYSSTATNTTDDVYVGGGVLPLDYTVDAETGSVLGWHWLLDELVAAKYTTIAWNPFLRLLTFDTDKWEKHFKTDVSAAYKDTLCASANPLACHYDGLLNTEPVEIVLDPTIMGMQVPKDLYTGQAVFVLLSDELQLALRYTPQSVTGDGRGPSRFVVQANASLSGMVRLGLMVDKSTFLSVWWDPLAQSGVVAPSWKPDMPFQDDQTRITCTVALTIVLLVWCGMHGLRATSPAERDNKVMHIIIQVLLLITALSCVLIVVVHTELADRARRASHMVLSESQQTAVMTLALCGITLFVAEFFVALLDHSRRVVCSFRGLLLLSGLLVLVGEWRMTSMTLANAVLALACEHSIVHLLVQLCSDPRRKRTLPPPGHAFQLGLQFWLMLSGLVLTAPFLIANGIYPFVYVMQIADQAYMFYSTAIFILVIHYNIP